MPLSHQYTSSRRPFPDPSKFLITPKSRPPNNRNLQFSSLPAASQLRNHHIPHGQSRLAWTSKRRTAYSFHITANAKEKNNVVAVEEAARDCGR